MITQTSKLAYKQLNEEGIGDTQKSKILYVVRDHYKTSDKGLSLREISNLTNFEINAVSGRVNDLKKDGLLETTHKRKCSYTKRLVSPVIPKKDNSVFIAELQDKILLLLGIYGYDKTKVSFQNNLDTNNVLFTIRYKYWELIDIEDCKKIEQNAGCLIVPCHWEDSDTGDNFSYEVKDNWK